MAFEPFTKDDQPTMQAFNEKFRQAMEQAIDSGVKIEVGSYVGTGTIEESNPNVLTLSFAANAVFVFEHNPDYTPGYEDWDSIAIEHIQTFIRPFGFGTQADAVSAFEGWYTKVEWDGNTIKWYLAGNSDETIAKYQANRSGVTYSYIAIRIVEVT